MAQGPKSSNKRQFVWHWRIKCACKHMTNDAIRLVINLYVIETNSKQVILDSASSIEISHSQDISKVNGSHSLSGEHLALNGHASEKTTNGEHNNTWPYLIPISASNEKSIEKRIADLQHYLTTRPDSTRALAHTLGNYRAHLPYRAFAILPQDGGHLQITEPFRKLHSPKPKIAFVFTGQGAQWAGMGKSLLLQSSPFRQYVIQMDHALQSLPEPPNWKIEGTLNLPQAPSSPAKIFHHLLRYLQICSSLINLRK